MPAPRMAPGRPAAKKPMVVPTAKVACSKKRRLLRPAVLAVSTTKFETATAPRNLKKFFIPLNISLFYTKSEFLLGLDLLSV